MATRTIANAGGNWNTAATWVEVAVPTAADDVIATATSSQLTVDIPAAVCRSINLTSYVNTLTIQNATSLTIGTTTLPPGSIALKFPTGMTVACNTPSLVGGLATGCGLITFSSTAVGVQTVDFNSNNVGQVGSVTFNGVGASWKLLSTLNGSWWNTVTLTNGTLDFNDQTCDFGRLSSTNSNIRTLTLGAATITLHSVNPSGTMTWDFGTTTNLTCTANTATVKITQEQTAGNNLWGSGTFNYNGLSLIMNGFGALHTTTGGTATVKNLTVMDDGIPTENSTWYTASRYQVNSALTVTGTLSFQGYDSGRRLRVQSNSGISLRTFTVTGATVAANNVDFLAIGFNVAQTFAAFTVGDEGANSGITFPTGATQFFYAPGTGNKRWSYPGYWFLGSGGTGGAGRCPLPQDTVRFDSASFDSAGVTVISDSPKLGGGMTSGGVGIDWTGVTNSPTWYFERSHLAFGDMKLAAGMSLGSTRNATLALQVLTGTFAFKWTSSGVTWPLPITFNLSATSTVQLQDDIVVDAVTGYLTNNRGSITSSSAGLDCNNKNVTVNSLNNSSGLLTMGSGTFTLTGRGTVWQSGGTISAGTSLIKLVCPFRYAKTFAGNGRTYNNIEFSGAGDCAYTITGSNTFNDFKSSKLVGFDIIFTGGITTTVTTFTVAGTADKYVRLRSTNTTAYTLTKAGGGAIASDYLIVSRSTASPGATWSATNSIDGGNNTAWSGLGDGPKTWTGAINSNFSNGGNWTGGVAPGSSDIAFFLGSHNVACTIDAAANVKGFYIGTTYTSTITQAATVTVGTNHYQHLSTTTFLGATQALIFTGDFIQLTGTFTPSSGGTTFDGTQDNFFSATGAYNIGNVIIGNSGAARLLLLTNMTLSGVGQTLTINAGSMLDNNGLSITVNSTLTVNGYWRSTGADATTGIRTINSATSTIELSGGNQITLGNAFSTDFYNLILVSNKIVNIIGGTLLTINGTVSPGTADMFTAQATPGRGQCSLWSTISGVMWRLNLQGTSTLGPAIDIQDCDARYGKWFDCKGSTYLLSHVCKPSGNYRCIEKPTRAGQVFRSRRKGNYA